MLHCLTPVLFNVVLCTILQSANIQNLVICVLELPLSFTPTLKVSKKLCRHRDDVNEFFILQSTRDKHFSVIAQQPS